MEVTPQLEQRANDIIAQFPKKKSAAMLLMHLIQETFGHFDDDAIAYIAKKLEVENIEIYGMMSFYPMFTQEKKGHVHIKVCRTLSCAMAGSINLAQEISKELDCPIGETKSIYTIEFVECLGNCVKAPNVQINDTLHDNVSVQRAAKFIEMIKEKKFESKDMFAEPQNCNEVDSPEFKG